MISAQELGKSGSDQDIQSAIDAAARRVAKMRLEVPAVFFLEMNKPLVTLYHTGALFLSPFASALFGAKNAF